MNLLYIPDCKWFLVQYTAGAGGRQEGVLSGKLIFCMCVCFCTRYPVTRSRETVRQSVDKEIHRGAYLRLILCALISKKSFYKQIFLLLYTFQHSEKDLSKNELIKRLFPAMLYQLADL